jgi:Predicted ornithine cyclodeaminase, mu-crystallin homolog
MPLLLSETDLAPLYRDPAAMDSLLDRIEESMRAFNRGAVAGQVRLETSLSDRTKKYRITTSAVPSAGQGMRINALFRGAKDSYFILLFDEERGDLLALVAGAALNVWRTGAPAGVPADISLRRAPMCWDSSAAGAKRAVNFWRFAGLCHH